MARRQQKNRQILKRYFLSTRWSKKGKGEAKEVDHNREMPCTVHECACTWELSLVMFHPPSKMCEGARAKPTVGRVCDHGREEYEKENAKFRKAVVVLGGCLKESVSQRSLI